MRYYNKNFNNTVIKRLVDKILLGIDDMLTYYRFLFNDEEISKILDCKEMLNNIYNNPIDFQLSIISIIEENLKEFSFKCFDYEKENGNSFISWLKDDNVKEGIEVVSSTFFNKSVASFCDSKIGIKYEVPIEGFIAACEKDAATLVETSDKKSLYTVKDLDENRVINSYNFATPIITPHQIFQFDDNSYLSKHNEIILDGKYIKPISIVCLDDSYKNMAETLSQRFSIPVEGEQKTK